MVVSDACPECPSNRYQENGHPRPGTQHHQGRACGRKCVASPEDHIIADGQRTLISIAGNSDLPAVPCLLLARLKFLNHV